MLKNEAILKKVVDNVNRVVKTRPSSKLFKTIKKPELKEEDVH